MEDEIKQGNMSILDHVLGPNAVPENEDTDVLNLCTCRYEYNDDFKDLDADRFAKATAEYQSMLAARCNLILTPKKEDRLVIAEAILHDVIMFMKDMGYVDVDYNNIREDMDKETAALIAITDIITIYSRVLYDKTHMKIEKVSDIISDDIENSNLEYVNSMGTEYDDHDVSGLIDESI